MKKNTIKEGHPSTGEVPAVSFQPATLSPDFYFRLIEHIAESVIATDQQRRICSWNKGSELLYGWKEEEVLGKNIHDLLQTRFDNVSVEDSLRILYEEGSFRMEGTRVNKNGDRIAIYNSTSLVRNAQGEAIGLVIVSKDISERKRLEAELKRLNEQLKDQVRVKTDEINNVFERIEEGFVSFDSDCNVIYANPRIHEIAGRDFVRFMEDGLGKKHHASPQAMLRELLKTAMDKRKHEQYSRFHETLGKWLEINIYPDANGASVFVRDITEQKTAEEKLHKKNRLYQFISQINQMIVHTSDEETLFRKACEIAVETGGFMMSWIGLPAGTQNQIKPLVVVGDDKGYFKEISISASAGTVSGMGPTGTAFREGKPVFCNDIDTDPRMAPWREAALARGFRASMSVPIFRGGKSYATYTVYAHTKNFFDKEEIDLLVESATDLSFALEVLDKEINRQKAEQELISLNDRFYRISSATHDVIWDWDLKENTLWWNANFYQLFGEDYRFDASDPETWLRHIHPDYREKIMRSVKQAIDDGETFWSAEYRFNRKDGVLGMMYDRGLIMRDEHGVAYRMIGSMADITSLKETEKELLDYQLALDKSAVVVITDNKGNIQHVNDNFCAISKFSRDELIGKNLRITNSGYHPKSFFKELWDTILDGKIWRGEVCNRAKDGSLYWLYSTIIPFQDIHGNPIRFVAIRFDITEKKKAVERMQIMNELYENVSMATSDIIRDWDLVTNKVRYHERMYDMLGYTEADFNEDPSFGFERMHPEDVEKVRTAFDNAVQAKANKFHVEYRFRTAQGNYKYLYERTFLIYSPDGMPIRMVAAIQDMTLQKEEDLRITGAYLEAQENERNLLGRELHDNINQILVGSLLGLDMSMRAQSPEKIQDFVGRARSYVAQAIDEIRRLSHRLAPASFKDLSLQEVIESLLHTFHAQQQFELELSVDAFMPGELDEAVQTNLYRVCQEQVSNIIRYAKATSLRIHIRKLVKSVLLVITDNGVGFDPSAQFKGIGLNNMRKRVEVLGGTFLLETAPGKGCKVIVEIPLIPGIIL
jgi:PAS domain S-box-containing protein